MAYHTGDAFKKVDSERLSNFCTFCIQNGSAANAAQAITRHQCYGRALSHQATCMLYPRQKKLPLGKKRQ